MAALALLVFMTPSLAGWGQTKITDYANIVSGTSYYIGATTSGTDYYLSVDGSSLTTSIAGTAVTTQSSATPFIFTGSGTNWSIQFDDDNGYYLSLKNGKDNGKVQVVENAASFTASNQSGKIRLLISTGTYAIQKNNSGTQFGSYATTQTDVWLMEVPSGTTTYTITAISNNESYGTVALNGNEITATPEDGYRVSKTDPYTVTSGTATVTQNGNKFTVTPSSDCTVQINFEAIPQITGYNIDFENDLDCYVDWEFTNALIHSGITGVSAHGGSAWATNGNSNGNATNTASFQTKNKVDYPDVFTCYVSKESGNTTASNWKVQVSDDASSWTDVATQSAVSMNKGEWVEFSVSIKNAGYTNKYVRLYYSNSNAFRAVDDISLTTYTPTAVEEPVITVANPFTLSTSVSITCVTEGATIYYTTDGTYPTASSTQYTEAFTINETTTIKAIAIKGSDESTIAEVTAVKELATPTVEISSSNLVIDGTATVTTNGPAVTLTTSDASIASVSGTTVTGVAVGTATITASWSENSDYSAGTKDFSVVVTDPNASGGQNNPYTVAQALAASPSNGVFVHGIISTITEVSTSYGNATYRISDDGTTSGEMIVYRGKYLENAAFTSSDQIQVGDIVTVTGDLTEYSGANQLAQGNYLVSLERPGVATYTIMFSVNGVLNEDLQRDVQGAIGALPNPDAADIPSGFTFMGWMISPSTPYYNATTAPSMVDATWEPGEDEILEAVFARVNSTPGTWTLSNTVPENGDQVIMAALDGTSYYAMNGPAGIEFSVSNNVITGDVPNAVFEAEISMAGSYLKQGSNYLHFNSSALKLASGTTNGDITYATLNDGFSLYANNRYMTYNSTTHGFGVNQSESNAATIYVFKYIAGSESISDYTTLVYTKDITGYGSSQYGYTLIASPIDDVNPENVTGMTDGNFDLYRFNESAVKEWENWKQEGEHNHFDLERGKGYLYAHKTDVTLAFAGTPVQGTTFDVTLSNSGTEYRGMNLVGNPFGQRVYVTVPFFVMNGEGSGFEAANRNYIEPMEGIIVDAANGTTLTFTTEAPSNSGDAKVALNLSRNRGDVIDRAIVRFGEGSQLHKFQLRENSTKVYFTEGNQDFAVVRSQKAQGEMPVNFKAEENGTYTLSVNTEEMELNYLHLVDNMTGMDVDLLQTPSYTFDATTNDYASRFRLVFSANGMNENGETETFAFYSNGNWVVGNEGEASLQVIDVNGRIVSNETINGTVATSINATPGVYMLRLVNGNEVKTQKIVVR